MTKIDKNDRNDKKDKSWRQPTITTYWLLGPRSDMFAVKNCSILFWKINREDWYIFLVLKLDYAMSNVLRCNLWTFDNNIFIVTSWHKYKFWLLQQQQYRNCSTTEIQSLNGFSSGHIKYNCFRNAKYRKQYNYSFKTLRISTGNSQCLKIYKNVSFRIFNFGIFLSDLLKLSCLVTLFDCKL